MKNTTTPTPKVTPSFLSDGLYVITSTDRFGSSNILAATVHGGELNALVLNGIGSPARRIEELQNEIFALISRRLHNGTCQAYLSSKKAAAA